MKTPGVYIVEKSAFPNSAVEVATAIPAFVGHTERAMNGSESLLNVPFRITSMAEYHAFFGGAPVPKFNIADPKEDEPSISAGGKQVWVEQTGLKFTLYYQMLMFFANGGGPCYVVSVGNYSADAFDLEKFQGGVDLLLKEQEPTMVLAPEAVNLEEENCYALYQAILAHCGGKMRNRIALLDVFGGYKSPKNSSVIKDFREKIGGNYLDFGIAYYPWLNTSVVQERDLSYLNFDGKTLKALLEADLALLDENKKELVAAEITKVADDTLDAVGQSTLHKTLTAVCPSYTTVLKEAKRQLNLLPPSAAMAGIYTMVDNTRGVWKAPANVTVNSVISPTVNLTNDDQEDLNVPLSGKAVNAIRSFVGEGIKVWGARTLDGNSLDWRYINVRRTMIMLEESVKNATRAYVFDPNTAGTWINIKSMIQNFLNGIWKRGGLAGATPDDAFSVHVGLGETMTPEDILEGILRVTVLVAVVRPAEFIEITFQQQMQKS